MADQTETSHLDGWANLATGTGDPAKDKRKSSVVVPDRLFYADCSALYQGDDMAARIVDIPAAEMCREWVEFVVGGDKDLAEDVGQQIEDINAQSMFEDAIAMAREFGGSGLLIGAKDGAADGVEPLRLDAVKSLDYLTLLDLSELVPWTWYQDPREPKYGQPATYKIRPRMLQLAGPEQEKAAEYINGLPEVHETRVLRFEGTRLSRLQMMQAVEFRGWPDSVLNRVYSVLQDFQGGFDSIAHLMTDVSQGVMKMKGLHALIGAKGATAITGRLQGVNISRGVARVLLLDADGEEFKREATPLAGIPETIDKLMLRLAAAADMPVALMMGQSPAGLNATGDSDLRWFYAHIAHKQRRDMLPQLRYLTQIAFRAIGAKEPKRWSVKARPLWSLSELEEADRRLKIAQADALYMTNQAVSPEEIATSRFSGDGYSIETQLLEDDPEQRAVAASEQAEEEAANAAKVAAAQPQPGKGVPAEGSKESGQPT